MGNSAVMKPITPLQIGPGATVSGPNKKNRRFHDKQPFVRRLMAASAFRVLSAASFLRLPAFFPDRWPLGPALLYIFVFAAGIYAALFLGLLTSLSGNTVMAIAIPTVFVLIEFVFVPIIKFPSFLGKSVAAMRAFLALDPQAAEAFDQEAHGWGLRDWLAAIIVIACFAAKAYVLVSFGTFQPAGLLLFNWTVAIADLAAHLAGLTSKVPYYALARVIDYFDRRRRLKHGAKWAETNGVDQLGALEGSQSEFESDIELTDDEVDGHTLEHVVGTNDYLFTANGTVDDRDRASLIARQTKDVKQAVFAREIARVQLKQLDAPEMRTGNGPAGAAPALANPKPPTPLTPVSVNAAQS